MNVRREIDSLDRFLILLNLHRLVAIDIWQAADVVALQTAMQRRARQVRDRGLQAIEAVVQRQERMPPERDDDRLLLDRQHRGSGILRPVQTGDIANTCAETSRTVFWRFGQEVCDAVPGDKCDGS